MDYLVAAAESGEKVPAVPQGYALQPVDIDHHGEEKRRHDGHHRTGDGQENLRCADCSAAGTLSSGSQWRWSYK